MNCPGGFAADFLQIRQAARGPKETLNKPTTVIPAHAGIQLNQCTWTPAFTRKGQAAVVKQLKL
jgi:hypothetical protein